MKKMRAGSSPKQASDDVIADEALKTLREEAEGVAFLCTIGQWEDEGYD